MVDIQFNLNNRKWETGNPVLICAVKGKANIEYWLGSGWRSTWYRVIFPLTLINPPATSIGPLESVPGKLPSQTQSLCKAN